MRHIEVISSGEGGGRETKPPTKMVGVGCLHESDTFYLSVMRQPDKVSI